MICDRCGAKHEEDIFCPVCGAPVRKVAIKSKSGYKKKNSHLMGKILTVCVILTSASIIGIAAVSANTKVQSNNIQEEEMQSEKLVEKSDFKCNNSDYNLNLYYITNNNELKKAGSDNVYMSDTLNIGNIDGDNSIKITSYKNNIIQRNYDDGSKITVEMDVTDNGRQNVIVKKDGRQTKLIEECNNNVTVKFSQNGQYFYIYTYDISTNVSYSKENEMTYADVTDIIYIMNSEGECIRTYENGMHNALVTYYNNYVVDITDDGSILYYNYGNVILVSSDDTDRDMRLCEDNTEVCSLAFVDRDRHIAGFRSSSKMNVITYANRTVERYLDTFECRNAWIYDEDTAELIYTDLNNKIILLDMINNIQKVYDNSIAITKLIMNERYFCINQYNTIIVIDKITGQNVYEYKVNAEASAGELTMSFIKGSNILVINNPLGDCVIWDGDSQKLIRTEKTIYNLNVSDSDDTYYTAVADGELGLISDSMQFYPVTTDYMTYSVTDNDKTDEYNYSTSMPRVYDNRVFYINSHNELIEYNMQTRNSITVADDVKGYLIIK